MSLHDRGYQFEPCTVYPEVVTTDADGNTITKASTTGIPTLARFQIQSQSGTSSRWAEQTNGGFDTERVYTVKFTREFDRLHGELGAQAVIEWRTDSQGRPARWQIFGDVQRYTSSRRTAHTVYTLKRS